MSGVGGIVFDSPNERVNYSQRESLLAELTKTGPGRSDNSAVAEFASGIFVAVGSLQRHCGIAKLSVHGRQMLLGFYGTLYNLEEVVNSHEDHDTILALLGLYIKDRLKFIQRLRGDFVFALWDGSCETLYLATDRFRVQPIFYAKIGSKLLFASRLKALLHSSLLNETTINPQSILNVVGSSLIPSPNTIFQEVKKLPPGYLLIYRGGNVETSPYWDIDFRCPNQAAETDLIKQVKGQLRESIAVRLETEADSLRVGAFLSGGVDSSTVTGLMTQIEKRPIKSFSIGFADEDFNEICYARIAAEAFRSEHYEYFVAPKDVLSVIPILLASFDEPFANASAIPTYYCAKMAKEHGVDVLYAGDGGDELFAGNERYATQRLFDYYQQITPRVRNSFITPLVFTLARSLKWSFIVNAQKYIKRSSIPYPERLYSYGFLKNIDWHEWFSAGILSAVGKDFSPYEEISSHYFQAKGYCELDRQLYIDLKLTISDNDLFKVTRMTEAAGVAVRYPFLDHRFAEFAARIPASVKMRGLKLRSFFKKAYADLLPQEIRSKAKHGFGLPIPIWLRTDKNLNELMHDLVLSPRSLRRGYFRKPALEDLVERHRVDETTSFHGTILWNLMLLELWHRTVIDNRLTGN